MSETQQPAAATAVETAAAAPPASHGIIDAWFIDHFNSLPLGWETAMRNHIVAAVADLKLRFGA